MWIGQVTFADLTPTQRLGCKAAGARIRDVRWMSTITGFGYTISAPHQTLYYNMRRTVSVSSAPCCELVMSSTLTSSIAASSPSTYTVTLLWMRAGNSRSRQGPLTSAIQELNPNVNETEQAPSTSYNRLRRNLISIKPIKLGSIPSTSVDLRN